MSYKQYYCNKTDGMKLRSGTVINCLASSTLLKDWEEAIKHTTYTYIRDQNFTNQQLRCLSLNAVLMTLEKHSHSIIEEPNLFGFYQMALIKLPEFSDGVKKHGMPCNCYEIKRVWGHIWKVNNYKMLPEISKNQHKTEEMIERIERLHRHFKLTMHKKERDTIEALTLRVNEDCAKHILSYM